MAKGSAATASTTKRSHTGEAALWKIAWFKTLTGTLGRVLWLAIMRGRKLVPMRAAMAASGAATIGPGGGDGDPRCSQRQDRDADGNAVGQVEKRRHAKGRDEKGDQGPQAQRGAGGKDEQQGRHPGHEHGDERRRPVDGTPRGAVLGRRAKQAVPGRADHAQCCVRQRQRRPAEVGQFAYADGDPGCDPEHKPDPAF